MLRAVLGSVVLAVVASSSFARDIVLENYPPAGTLGIVSAFGWGPPGIGVANEYWAQTFKVPEDAGALSRVEFTFHAALEPEVFGYDTTHDIPFRLLITPDLDPEVTEFRPGDVIFESHRLVSPYVPLSAPEDAWRQHFAVDLAKLPVTPGRSYAFVLDAMSEYVPDTFSWRTGASTRNRYESGDFFSLRVPRDSEHQPVGTRADHFAETWNSFAPENIDLQFRLTFVPEPSSAALSLCCGLGWIALRRRMTR